MNHLEIFDTETGVAVEIIECADLPAFRRDCIRRADRARRSFRIRGGNGQPFEYRVAKDYGVGLAGLDLEFLPFDDAICAEIAKESGGLSAGQVHHALMAGKTVYGELARFRLE